jgi:hypothetical protein
MTRTGTLPGLPPPGGELLDLIPRIRRARDFRLYTGEGRRFVDLWQAGGRAILGHTPPGFFRELKNTAGRGLCAPLPGIYGARFLKALGRLFPDRDFRFYADEASLRRALAVAGHPGDRPFSDPALGPPAPENPLPSGAALPGDPPVYGLALWRPFLDGSPVSAVPPAASGGLIPVLPMPLPGAPWVLAADRTRISRFPPSDLLSPVILAAAARSVYDLFALPARSLPPEILRALSCGRWFCRGIYCSPAEPLPEPLRTVLFRRFLARGFLLPPFPELPLILPPGLSPGEAANLAELLGQPWE